MALTTTWDIVNIETISGLLGKDNIVISIDWKVTVFNDGADGTRDNRASYFGTVQLGPPSDTNFVDFSTLTKEQVISWVKDTLGASKVAEFENNAYRVAALKSFTPSDRPLIKTDQFPWLSQ